MQRDMDILIHDGLVVTVDPQWHIWDPGSILVRGDRIADIGQPQALKERYPGASRIDAKGKLILPGFINTHTHFPFTMKRGMWEDDPYMPHGYRKNRSIMTLSAEESQVFGLLGALEALRAGTTTVIEQWFNVDDYAEIFLRVGLRAYLAELIFDADLPGLGHGQHHFDDRVGEQTLEKAMRLVERWHGKEDGRIQCMLGPHANDTVSPNLFRKVRDLAEDRELRIFYHLSEAQSQVDYIVEQHGGKQPVQFLADLDFLGPSLIAVHAIYLKEHEIALLARHGVHIAHSPGFNGRRGRAAPVPTMLRNGVNVTLGTDTPSGDMFDAMRLGLIVARIMEHEATWPTPDDYLAMATINGARALGLEGEVGSLEVGKKADIVLINLDRLHLRPMGRPISTLVHYGMGADVDVVLVDGRLLVANGCLIGVDEDELLQLAQTIMENKRAEFGELF